MRIITDNPIVEDHSNAFGDKFRERRARKGKTSGGIKKSKSNADRFLSKQKRSDRKAERELKREGRDGFFSKTNRDARKQKRMDRRAVRKGATPLKATAGPGGTKVYSEPMPTVVKNTDGSLTKVVPGNLDNPSEVVTLSPTDVVEIPTPGPGPGILVDKKDLNENPEKTPVVAVDPVTKVPEVVKQFVEEEIEIVKDESTGQEDIYKKTDLSGKAPMSKGLKIGLIVGGVVVVGVISYLIYKRSTKVGA